ncbi:MAG: DUF3016 domain-containing protein [Paraglaciecola sp.]|nr:DUF3016 domain-containing protein [Paraglaciecola sp.]NCT47981.1 DUF3016 domain-containing protein [Paraglaciecola sp.]
MTFKDPQNYRDIEPTDEGDIIFQSEIFAKLQDYMQSLAARLPNQQILQITVTDIDLAGRVLPANFLGFGNIHNADSDVRVMKATDRPSMKFSYTLVDYDGVLVKQGEVDLDDENFRIRDNRQRLTTALRNEKYLLKNWFDDEFPEHTAKN